MRKITVVSSDTQSKVTFETEAATVAELLAELTARNIDYTGKELFEGISHTVINPEVETTVLPHDNQYHGVVTNDLVIMVTSGKKIKSGMMSRADAYAHIKDLGMEEDIKNAFGKNYTNLPTATLVDFLESATGKPENKAVEEEACQKSCPLEDFICGALCVAVERGLISAEAVLAALHAAGAISISKEEVPSSFSDEDIQEMFKGYMK